MRQLLRDLLVPVMIALSLAFLVQATLAKPYRIPTESMQPTIRGASESSGGDRILANRLIYRFRDVGRGDIIVFDAPRAARRTCSSAQDPDIPFVKRVIAVAGDTVEVPATGPPIVNGEPYVVSSARLPSNNALAEETVPAGHVFVLGDNRPQSCDSSQWTENGLPGGTPAPFVDVDSIIGQAEAIYWPANRISMLN